MFRKQEKQHTAAKHAELPLMNVYDFLSCPRAEIEGRIRALCQTAYLGENRVLARHLGRYKIYLDSRDIGLASHVMLDGNWEFWICQYFLRTCERGWRMVDVGANFGCHALLLAEIAGPQGQLDCFEPNPYVAKMLQDSVSINGFGPWTRVHAAAAGDQEKTVAFAFDLAEPKNAHIIRDEDVGAETLGTTRVPLVVLDNVLGTKPIQLIKIDAEGAEEMVWAGMRKILDNSPELIVVLEFNIHRCDNGKQWLQEFRDRGFKIGNIRFDGCVHPIGDDELLDLGNREDFMLELRRSEHPRARPAGR